MKISRKLAHKLQNMIQLIMSYIELKKEDRAKKTLREMSIMIEHNTVETIEDCDECPHQRKEDDE